MLLNELTAYLDQLLSPAQFKDYCPNGLQIEGSSNIERIVTGVSINQELINQAIAQKANAIITHHGLLWANTPAPIIGVHYKRIASLIKHNISLLAYHLPLDNHATLGNNYQLAQLLNFKINGQTGVQNLLWYGRCEPSLSLAELAKLYFNQTQHQPLIFGDQSQQIQTVAWCTGAADSLFSIAIDLGVDCFITGEAKEPIKHLAKESQVAYLAGGHYVTERYGILALTKHLQELGLATHFVEIYNPL